MRYTRNKQDIYRTMYSKAYIAVTTSLNLLQDDAVQQEVAGKANGIALTKQLRSRRTSMSPYPQSGNLHTKYDMTEHRDQVLLQSATANPALSQWRCAQLHVTRDYT